MKNGYIDPILVLMLGAAAACGSRVVFDGGRADGSASCGDEENTKALHAGVQGGGGPVGPKWEQEDRRGLA
jgi:hypothetical protein